MTLLLGIDCGGTNTKCLLAREADGQWSTLRRAYFPTPQHPQALSEITTHVQEFVGPDEPDAFGFAVPGIINECGRVIASSNVRWLEGTAPADAISAALGAPGVVVNDGAATARAEVVLGAARGNADVFVLSLGTGIAGAHVIEGEIRRGAHGAAGEIGHVSLGGDRPCSCGQHGCLETFVGGTQLGQRWAVVTGAPAGSTTARDLIEAAGEGDARAAAILDEAATALARSVLDLVAIVDPSIIVVGGGVAQAWTQILEPTIAKARAAATFHHVPPIVPAHLGMWGAAWGTILAAHATAGLEPSPA